LKTLFDASESAKIKEPGTKSEGILVLRPSNQKMLYQDLFGKKLMLSGLMLWKISLLRM
jgi:hypothetical protein